MRYKLIKNSYFVYLSGKPIIPHFLRCRGLAVADYSFALGRLGSGASSAFAHLGFKFIGHKARRDIKAKNISRPSFFIVRLLTVVVCLLCTPAMIPAQDTSTRMHEINEQIKTLGKELKNCKDTECITRVSTEMNRLVKESGKIHNEQIKALGEESKNCRDTECVTRVLTEMNRLAKESYERGVASRNSLDQIINPQGLIYEIPCIISVRNRVECKEITTYENYDSKPELCKKYINQYYVFEYEAQTDGYFTHHDDFSDFYLQTKSSLAYDKPGFFRILECSGYYQIKERDILGRWYLKKYPDGSIKEIYPPEKRIGLKISYSGLDAIKHNINFYPLQATVANTGMGYDTSYKPDPLNTPLFDRGPMPVGFVELEANPKEFIISPDDMRAALKAGRLEREFRWRCDINELGSYRQNTLNIDILFGPFDCGGDKNNTAGSVAFSGSCTEDGGIVLGRRGSVFVNGKPIARAGDRVFSTFDGVVEIVGKQDWKVFVEGKPVARVGDVTTKGVKIIGGSKDTFMGQ